MNILENEALYHKLRSEFIRFEYKQYNHKVDDQSLHVDFMFTLVNTDPKQSVTFNPKSEIIFPEGFSLTAADLNLDILVFHIGMAELVSYWKIACPPVIDIQSGLISAEQLDWWKTLYFWGQQEFFYVNGIPAPKLADYAQLVCTATKPLGSFSFTASPDRNMVPIGGGKDSAVTLNAITNLADDNYSLIINPRGASIKTMKIGGLSANKLVTIKRAIDPKLIELNKTGFREDLGALNGHTPFSATLAYYSLVAAYGIGTANIVLSNESSADEATVPGTNINHQYSKSFEFEQNFRAYVKEYISTDFNYYSFLRPLNELQIGGLFASTPQYHTDFKSCNVGSKQNIWCCNCSKCLFTYIILSPFIEPTQLAAIFGEDLFNNAKLQQEFDELIGVADVKPFECVGTVDEVNAALAMAISKFYNKNELPLLLEYYVGTDEYDMEEGLESGLAHLSSFAMEHNLKQTDFVYLSTQISQVIAKLAEVFKHE